CGAGITVSQSLDGGEKFVHYIVNNIFNNNVRYCGIHSSFNHLGGNRQMRTRLSIAVRNAIIGTTGAISMAAVIPAHAQDNQQALEEISVTGSRIRGTELVGTAVM